MPIPWPQAVLILGILLLSSMLQGAVGFASGLFGIPLFLMTGLTLPQAVAVSMVGSAVQNVTAAYRLRREIDFRKAARPVLIRLAVMPLGVWALYIVGNAGRDVASQLVGVVVLAILAVQQVYRVEPRDELHVGWEWLAFGVGGFLLGFCGMGGPPMVLWVMAHRWPMTRAKAFLFFVFASCMLPQAFVLYLFFGGEILRWMALGLAAVPILVVGTLLGLRLAHFVRDHHMRRVIMLVLVLIAASAIVMPLL